MSLAIAKRWHQSSVCQIKENVFYVAADDSPFFDNDMPTMRSSSSSSEGLPHAVGLNWEGSVESNEVTRGQKSHCSVDKRHIFDMH